MKKRRLIPLILVKNGNVVQSRNFKKFQNIGNPFTSIKRCSEWGSDELIILDISRDPIYDSREDTKFKKKNSFHEIIDEISKIVFMPLSIGGKIKSLFDIEQLLLKGADKVVINTEAFKNIDFIKIASKEFGSQCIIISIDVKKINNEYFVFIENGQTNTKMKLENYLKIVNNSCAGEVIVNSIDNDGTGVGFDIELINLVENNIDIPQICCGGAGNYDHFIEIARASKVDGIAAANFFQHVDQSVFFTKKKLFENKLNFREPKLVEV